jgi:DNA-binding YbaB/EbfC family protein
MFKEMGALASLLRALPRMKEEFEGLQKRLAQITVEADAGAGMVRVKVNGRMEVLHVHISEEAAADRELLEELIRSAINAALDKARQRVAEESSQMLGGLGLGGAGGMPDLAGLMGS